MRKFGLFGVLLVGLLSVTLLRPARAQESTWTCFFDFSIGELGWSGSTQAGSSTTTYSSAWQGSMTTTAPDGQYFTTVITRTFTTDLTGVSVTGWVSGATTADVGYSTNGTPVSFGHSEDGEFIRTLTTTASGSIVFEAWVNVASGLTSEIRAISLSGTGDIPSGFDDDADCTTGTGGRTRPLAAADELNDVGIFDFDYVHTLSGTYDGGNRVFAYSETAGANVAAVAAGTVTSITPFTPDDCAEFLPVFTFGNGRLCDVVIPGVLSENAFNNIYSLQMVNISKVIITDAIDPTIFYGYAVYKTTLQVGDVVVAGCVIGQTITLKPLPLGALTLASTILSIGISGGLGFLSPDTDAGVAFIEMAQDGETQSLYPTLTEQPNDADCQEEQLSACVNANPNLSSFAYYDRETDVTLLDGGGVDIPAFNYITQKDIMIDPDADYILTVQARKRETGDDTDISRMNLQIGSQLDSFDVLPSYHNYTLTTSGDDWHTDNMTSIFISNQPSSVASIEVKYVCLAPVTASTAPGSCYFANNEFDSDAAGWDVSATTFSSGEAFMRDGSTLSQTVLLKPDESSSHIYTIRAVARLLATGSYTGQIGKSVTLNYQFPVLGDVTEVGTIDSALVAANGTNLVSGNVELDYPYTLETTIEISEDTDSAFTFSVVVEDSDNYIQGLRLDSVCIDPQGDGSFPGQDGGGGYHPPFLVGCQVVPVPLENSIGPWIFYHWANLRRFFNCDLMKLLNKWFTLFDQFRKTMLAVARWWIALVHYGSNWLTSFLWYLNGSFHNIALGQVTTITESGGCHDIFCAAVDIITTLANLLTPVITALNGVAGVLLSIFVSGVSFFFTLISGLVGVVIALIIRLVFFLQTAGALLAGIIGAYNTATPIAIPGLPLCATDPTSNIICTGVWVTDNTIFSGRWGTLFAIILSVASIHLILWAIAEFKAILLKTWGSS